jgi:subtilase family serine protease
MAHNKYNYNPQRCKDTSYVAIKYCVIGISILIIACAVAHIFNL